MKLLRVPPATVISASVKLLAASLRLKVSMAVAPLIKELLDELMEMVGGVMSTLMDNERMVLLLPAASRN